MTEAGLPHSGTLGSSRARRSPRHFAVRRALHRLLAPRHPPAALCSLIFHAQCGHPERDRHHRGTRTLRCKCSSPPPRQAVVTTIALKIIFTLLSLCSFQGSPKTTPEHVGSGAKGSRSPHPKARFPED